MSPARSILVVDDDDDLRETLVDALRFEGFVVASARDGQEGLEWLRGHADTRWIVLLDLMMPVMNGRAFLDARAADAMLATNPVIVLTAGGGCRELKAIGQLANCLPKTAPLHELLAAIASCA